MSKEKELFEYHDENKFKMFYDGKLLNLDNITTIRSKKQVWYNAEEVIQLLSQPMSNIFKKVSSNNRASLKDLGIANDDTIFINCGAFYELDGRE